MFNAKSRRFAIGILLGFMVAAIACSEPKTVPKEKYDEVTGEVTRLRAEKETLRLQLAQLQERFDVAKLQNVEVLKTQLDETQKLMREKEKSAYANGALDVFKSIEFKGIPDVKPGWIWDDYYYDFEVRLGGHTIVTQRVKTETKENEIAKPLSAVWDVANVLSALKR